MKALAKLLNEYQDRKDLTNDELASKLKITPAHFGSVKYGNLTYIGADVAARILKLIPASKRSTAQRDIDKTNKGVLAWHKARNKKAKTAKKRSTKKSSKKTSKKTSR